jgi:hypothetical protein
MWSYIINYSLNYIEIFHIECNYFPLLYLEKTVTHRMRNYETFMHKHMKKVDMLSSKDLYLEPL